LHFNIRQDVGGVGFVFVSPYMSLVRSYEELMGFGNEPPGGPVDAVDCSSIRGWAQDPDIPDEPVTVEVWFDGPAGDPQATGVTIMADEHREDLCTALGSCNHGFALEIPLSLRDGQPHEVFVYAVDDDGGESPQLEASPGELQCAAVAPPDGVRRKVASPEMIAAWGLSTFWDLAKIGEADLEAIPIGTAWPEERLVIKSEADPTLWVVDHGLRRKLDAAAAEAWGINPGDALVWPDDSVQGVPLGPPMRSQVFLVSANGEGIYVMDDAVCPPNEPQCDDDVGGTTTSDGGTGDSGDDDSYPWDDPGADGDGGCGCKTGPAAPAPALFGLLLLALRRRSS
jgi:MYXO-CTERM domain-containing protein